MGSNLSEYNFKARRSSTDAPAIGGKKQDFSQDLQKALGIKLLTDSINQQSKGASTQRTIESMPEGVATASTDEYGVKRQSQNERFFTADAQNQLTRIKQLKEVVRGIQDLGNTLPTDPIRAFGGTLGAQKAYGRFGTSQHKTYLDSLPSGAVGAYRAVTGDNRLSDADASARALPLFWDPREPEDTREGKNAFLNFMMDQAEQGLTYQDEPKNDMESMIRWQNYINSSKEKFKNYNPNDVNNLNVNPSNHGENNNLDEDEDEIFNRLRNSV